jgi:hypothetical protein
MPSMAPHWMDSLDRWDCIFIDVTKEHYANWQANMPAARFVSTLSGDLCRLARTDKEKFRLSIYAIGGEFVIDVGGYYSPDVNIVIAVCDRFRHLGRFEVKEFNCGDYFILQTHESAMRHRAECF